MSLPKPSNLELSALTTVQTMVTRLEDKKAVRFTKRIGKANIFEAVSGKRAQRRLTDELLSLFGSKPVMAHMAGAGQKLRRLTQKEKSK